MLCVKPNNGREPDSRPFSFRYLKFNCPHHFSNGIICRSILGGISEESLMAYNFDIAPFRQLFNCWNCRHFVEIEIKGFNSMPKYRVLGRNEEFGAIKETDLFPLIEIEREGVR
jgi:hypothetical protein